MDNINLVTIVASVIVSTIIVTMINIVINYNLLKNINKITNGFIEEVKSITLDALKANQHKWK